jgi:HEAT repeat protein
MCVHDPSALHDEAAILAARRKGAAAEAGYFGDETAARAALDDEGPGVRAAALAALVRLKHATVSDLTKAASDGSSTVRRRAVELAWRAGLPRSRALPIALGLLSDSDPGTVEAAAYCLGELGDPKAARALEQVASLHDDPLCRESAVAALGVIGDEGSLATIVSACSDRPAVRRRAVLALAGYEGPEVDAALARALEDRDWQVRQAAEDLTSSRGRSG